MPSPVNLFDPSHYVAVRRPLLEAENLPAWCYRAPEFHAREVERIFLRSWLFVGRADEIANAGDYVTLDTPGGPVAIVRDREGALRAFANSCRHRGSRLLDGKGNRRSIVCPYHGWTYGLDGTLAGAPHMERTVGFERARHGLSPVALDSWQGFLFVSFDPAPPSLMEWLGDMPERFRCYNFSDMVAVRRRDYALACDWKLVLENALEDYHTAFVHRGSLGMQEEHPEPTAGQWEALFMPGKRTIALLPGEPERLPHIPTLAGNPARGTYFTVLYPNTQFACTLDCMWWLTFWPTGPARTRVSVGFSFPRGTVARPDFEDAAERYFHRWDVSIAEDNATGELQQVGLGSVLRRPGPYSWKETMVHRLANWVLDRVLDRAG